MLVYVLTGFPPYSRERYVLGVYATEAGMRKAYQEHLDYGYDGLQYEEEYISD